MPAGNEKTELFERTPISKAVMTLAIPTILISLVMVLYHMADTFFVGMLDGPIQNAALTLSGPVLLAFNAVNNLFGVGTSSMMNRALGAEHRRGGRGPCHLPLQLRGCLYFFVLLFVRRGKTFVCVKPSMFGFRRAIVLGIFGVGILASIQNLLNVTSRMVLNNFTAAYGPDAVAAMDIASTISSVSMQIALGGSQGIMPLIGYNYASGNVKRMKETVIFLTEIALGFMAVATGAMFFGARWFTLLFIQNESVVTFGTAFLRGLCLAQPFLCIDFTAVGVFQSCGMGRRALLFAVLRKIVMEIPALILLDKLFPPYGLAYSQLVAEVILSAAAVVMLLRIFRSLEKKNSPLEEGGKA